ncbi:hypothetical protein [Soonwooa sp.]|uniref:hypothetical protein n=1 Tax=Soonwooa sp. TaxID=1938592 RepID=UPI002608F030|nr:hypothetical protein [Soonwooa sp.]
MNNATDITANFGTLYFPKSALVFYVTNGTDKETYVEHFDMDIARALVTDAPILLCDEPTASLDAKSANVVMNDLRELAQSGKAVIVVTHDLRLRQYANRIIYVEEGNVSDTPKDETLYKQ